MGFHSTPAIETIVDTMQVGFTDRNTKLGDPDFINNPLKELLSKNYARMISQRILDNQLRPNQKQLTPIQELTDTTHYSIIDSKGNACAVTYTLNGFFGSKMIADHTGFFLNNEMDDFAVKAGSPNKFGLVQLGANAIQPKKRPLSSMAPTIIMKDNRVFMVIGSPGGPRIITAVLLTILNVIDYHLGIQQAVNAPRFHFQGEPNTIFAEPFSFSFLTTKQLEHDGYSITIQPGWAAKSYYN